MDRYRDLPTWHHICSTGDAKTPGGQREHGSHRRLVHADIEDAVSSLGSCVQSVSLHVALLLLRHHCAIKLLVHPKIRWPWVPGRGTHSPVACLFATSCWRSSMHDLLKSCEGEWTSHTTKMCTRRKRPAWEFDLQHSVIVPASPSSPVVSVAVPHTTFRVAASQLLRHGWMAQKSRPHFCAVGTTVGGIHPPKLLMR